MDKLELYVILIYLIKFFIKDSTFASVHSPSMENVPELLFNAKNSLIINNTVDEDPRYHQLSFPYIA